MIDFFLFVLLSSPLFYAALSRTNLANGSSTMDPTPSLSLFLCLRARVYFYFDGKINTLDSLSFTILSLPFCKKNNDYYILDHFFFLIHTLRIFTCMSFDIYSTEIVYRKAYVVQLIA